VRLLAHAKVNLVLRVGARRADGFHELDSLVAPISLADELELERTAGAGVRVTCTGGVRDTLVTRALEALLDATGAGGGFTVSIEKRVPVGGGLGGGSADAGRALRAANDLLPRPLLPSALLPIAAAVGSDVPFFLTSGPARLRGRGERVDPVPALPFAALLLASPGVGLSTASVYALHAPRGALPERLPEPSSFTELASALENDLGPAAERLCPACAGLRAELTRAGAAGTLVAGSGSTVFGLFPSLAEADAARSGIAGAAWSATATLCPS
jgi:4-diphosphocytidyl-2-C-methyl-D-erythritol kinase